MTPEQQTFVARYLMDGDAKAAAIAAGFKPRSATTAAAKLLADPEVQAALTAGRQAAVADTKQVTPNTRAQLLVQADEAWQAAKDGAKASEMVQVLMLRARLLGVLDSPEEAAERDRAAEDHAQARELRTAGQLLFDAASSYGLPRDASPGQIIGAASKRSIMTPELFRLLKAAKEGADQ